MADLRVRILAQDSQEDLLSECHGEASDHLLMYGDAAPSDTWEKVQLPCGQRTLKANIHYKCGGQDLGALPMLGDGHQSIDSVTKIAVMDCHTT